MEGDQRSEVCGDFIPVCRCFTLRSEPFNMSHGIKKGRPDKGLPEENDKLTQLFFHQMMVESHTKNLVCAIAR